MFPLRVISLLQYTSVSMCVLLSDEGIFPIAIYICFYVCADDMMRVFSLHLFLCVCCCLMRVFSLLQYTSVSMSAEVVKNGDAEV